MKSRWTPEAREKQRQAITRWKPWLKSTGLRTAQGKAQSAVNGVWGYTIGNLPEAEISSGGGPVSMAEKAKRIPAKP